jgi:hypothetical protein
MHKFKATAQPDGYVRLRITADNGIVHVFRFTSEETRRLNNELFGAWIVPIRARAAKLRAER